MRAVKSPFRIETPLGKAPAFALILSLIFFLVLKEELKLHVVVSAVTAVTASAGWFLAGTEYPAKSSFGVSCVLLSVMVLAIMFVDIRISSRHEYTGSIEADGVVAGERKWGFRRIALVRLKSSRAFAGPRKYVLKYEGGLIPGDIVHFKGNAERFARADEPGKFDEFLYWKSRGAYSSVTAKEIEVVGREIGPAYWRFLLYRRIVGFLPRRTAGYIAAAWLGERDPELSDFHRNAGTSHILAVSGLHVGIVAGLCWFLLKWVKFRFYLVSAVIWFYALFSGASPSSMRAALMIQFTLLGSVVGESSGAFNGACFAAALMLVFNPWLFWDVGWRLSVISVMTLASIYSLDIGVCAKCLMASPAVWLATSIQSAWTFGAVPLSGLVINFFAVPAFGVFLPVASILSIPSLMGLTIGRFFTLVVEIMFVLWERFSNNVTFLMPWKVYFSAPLFISGVAFLTYIFARASGFSRPRAFSILGLNTFFIFLYIIRIYFIP
jgi:competence protein ComEC